MAHLVAAGEDIFSHPHVQRCKLHRALLDDLEAIAKAARQLLGGEVDPPDTVWNGIQARLEFGREPAPPTVSYIGPGYRVMFAVKVIERWSSGTASPPSLDAFFQGEKPVRPPFINPARKVARREGR